MRVQVNRIACPIAHMDGINSTVVNMEIYKKEYNVLWRYGRKASGMLAYVCHTKDIYRY